MRALQANANSANAIATKPMGDVDGITGGRVGGLALMPVDDTGKTSPNALGEMQTMPPLAWTPAAGTRHRTVTVAKSP